MKDLRSLAKVVDPDSPQLYENHVNKNSIGMSYLESLTLTVEDLSELSNGKAILIASDETVIMIRLAK